MPSRPVDPSLLRVWGIALVAAAAFGVQVGWPGAPRGANPPLLDAAVASDALAYGFLHIAFGSASGTPTQR